MRASASLAESGHRNTPGRCNLSPYITSGGYFCSLLISNIILTSLSAESASFCLFGAFFHFQKLESYIIRQNLASCGARVVHPLFFSSLRRRQFFEWVSGKGDLIVVSFYLSLCLKPSVLLEHRYHPFFVYIIPLKNAVFN